MTKVKEVGMNKRELIEQIKEANKAYRLGNPIIDDATYDNLLAQLKQIDEQTYENLKQQLFDSKTGKVKHKYVVGSLNKITKPEEVEGFIDTNKTYIITPKLDGASIVLYFNDGKLQKAVTRGTSTEGEDRTEKAKLIVPNTIDYKGELIVRGEIIISKVNFKQYENEFKNARNFVAGIFNRKGDFEQIVKDFDIVVFEIMGENKPQNEQIELLKSLGFKTVMYELVKFDKTNAFEYLANKLQTWKQTYEYEIDGLVLTPEDYEFENVKYPVNKVAFKENIEKAISEVIDIEWQTTRTGKIVPVVIINPVELNGSTVKRVSMFNAEYLKKAKAGIGAIVSVIKAGEIIPKIDEVIKPSEQFNIPTKCPVCGSPVKQNGLDIECSNEQCPVKVRLQIVQLLKNLGIKGISEKTLIKYNINSFEALLNYEPKNKHSKIEQKLAEIKTLLKNTPIDEMFVALPMENLGEKLLNNIKAFYGLNNLLKNDLSKQGYPELCSDITLNSFKNQWSNWLDILNKIYAEDLMKQVNEVTNNKAKKPLAGISFCITGTLSKPRKHIEQMIKQYGGEIKGVSKNLNYLVVGKNPGSKLAKAKQIKTIQFIDENELMNLINEKVNFMS